MITCEAAYFPSSLGAPRSALHACEPITPTVSRNFQHSTIRTSMQILSSLPARLDGIVTPQSGTCSASMSALLLVPTCQSQRGLPHGKSRPHGDSHSRQACRWVAKTNNGLNTARSPLQMCLCTFFSITSLTPSPLSQLMPAVCLNCEGKSAKRYQRACSSAEQCRE